MSSNTPPPGKRKSSLNIFSFGPLSAAQDTVDRKTLKKKNRFSTTFRTGASSPESLGSKSGEDLVRLVTSNDSFTSRSGSGSGSPSSRPALSRRGGKPPSLFGNLRTLKISDDDTPPATATSASSRTPSFTWKEFGSSTDLTDFGKSKNVLHHGEAQTASTLFWKKKEYLVLTETHLIRFKNHHKAAEVFHSIQSTSTRGAPLRHSSTNSMESAHDVQSLSSDLSGERAASVALEWIVAVYLPDDARHAYSLEFSYLDNDASNSSSITLTFLDVEERDLWLRSIRHAANKARLHDSDPISPVIAEYVARAVEREQDYDVLNFKMYKIVKRVSPKFGYKASSDDSTKSASAVCFIVIGAHKVHLIHLPKTNVRGPASAVSEVREGGSFGIFTLTWISVNATDDTFTLAFRSPFQRAKSFLLASLASSEIAHELRARDGALRPEWTQRPFAFSVPSEEDRPLINATSLDEDHNCFDRTLVAFCVAYGIDPSSIRYTINYAVDDAPCFQLLAPISARDSRYSALQLLAVFRSLRYNESFSSISFAKVPLDALNRQYDRHGMEHLCTKTKHGTPLRLRLEEQQSVHILIQEVRALALGNKRLRRLDFSYAFSDMDTIVPMSQESDQSSCGIVEALYPLCKQQVTNVDWICLNGVQLCEVDLEYLVGIAADRTCHIRAIEASRCGLTDRGVSLLLDALRAHSNTLEVVILSNNTLRLVPSSLSRQLEAFGFIYKLDLSNLAVTAAPEPLLPLETLALWRLQELRLSGIPLNSSTVEDICGYLAHPHSEVLRELDVSNCSLTGAEAGLMMQSLTLEPGTARLLHLDLSGNRLQENHDAMVSAIARDLAPTHLSMRMIEFDVEDVFRELLLAVATNKSIRYLDLAKASLPAGASEKTCNALGQVFAANQTLQEFDISGEDARLEVSRLGKGIHSALNGLKHNPTLQTLRIQNQRLGLQGASKLADVLKDNTALRQLHCEYNDITLSGFTDLVNAMATNTTLLYLPSLEEGRHSAMKQTEAQIKGVRIKPDDISSNRASRIASVRRSFASRGTSKLGAVPKVGAVPEWTAADVQAALRLVHDSWETQSQRLQVFLERNWKMSMGLAVEQDPADEEPQRPGTAASVTKILEKVRTETTPTMEKQVDLALSPPAAGVTPDPAARELQLLAELAFDPSPIFEEDAEWTAPERETLSEPARSSATSPVNLDKALPPAPPPASRSRSTSQVERKSRDLTCTITK